MKFKLFVLVAMIVASAADARVINTVPHDLSFLKQCSFGSGLTDSISALRKLKQAQNPQNACEQQALGAIDQGYQVYQLSYVANIISKDFYCKQITGGDQLPQIAGAMFQEQWGQVNVAHADIIEIQLHDLNVLCSQ